MGVEDAARVRKGVVAGHVDRAFAGELALAGQDLAVQVQHQEILRAHLPLPPGARVAAAHVDPLADAHRQVAAGAVQQLPVVSQAADLRHPFSWVRHGSSQRLIEERGRSLLPHQWNRH